MITLGEKFTFIPHWNESMQDTKQEKRKKTVTGTVIYVNPAHKLFCIEYPCGGQYAKETFKFTDVGNTIFRFGGNHNGC